MLIGNILKKARVRSGLSQRELARKIGVKHNSISNWENNHNLPNGSTLYVLMNVLNVDFEELFGNDVDFNMLEDIRNNNPSELTKIQRLMLDVGDAQIIELIDHEKQKNSGSKSKKGFDLASLMEKDKENKNNSEPHPNVIKMLLNQGVTDDGKEYWAQDLERLYKLYSDNPNSLDSGERMALVKGLLMIEAMEGLSDLILDYGVLDDEGKEFIKQSMKMAISAHKKKDGE